MRVLSRLVVLSVVLILLSGSVISSGQRPVQDQLDWQKILDEMLAQQEQDLQDYRDQLQRAGEDVFADKQGQLFRAQAQKLHNEARLLKAQVEEEIQALQQELSAKLLREQLELMLLTLDEKGQEVRLERIAQVQEELQTAQEGLREEYEKRLLVLQEEHERRSHEETEALKAEVEKAMDDEFAQYQLTLLQQLEEEIAKMKPDLRSAHANR